MPADPERRPCQNRSVRRPQVRGRSDQRCPDFQREGGRRVDRPGYRRHVAEARARLLPDPESRGGMPDATLLRRRGDDGGAGGADHQPGG